MFTTQTCVAFFEVSHKTEVGCKWTFAADMEEKTVKQLDIFFFWLNYAIFFGS